jgi:CRISPR-associated protein Cas6
MLDVAFPLAGSTLPPEPRRPLARALEGAVPALAGWAGAGVHGLKLVHGGGAAAWLPGHARLLLRVPREHVAELHALAGRELDVDGHRVCLGALSSHELLPHNALYAELVLCALADDVLALLGAVDAWLRDMQVACHRVCGRRRQADDGRLHGYSLMLYELAAADSLRLLEQGLGDGRLLGCGLFVPHRSAAAAGG